MKNDAIIVPYQTVHAYEILERNVREQDLWLSDFPEWDRWVKEWKESGPAYTLIIDDQVVGCAGVILLGWNRGEAWTLFSSLLYRYKLTVIKSIRTYLERIARAHKLKRIQAQVRSDFREGMRFMEFMGFESEGVLKAFGPRGEDIIMYARIY